MLLSLICYHLGSVTLITNLYRIGIYNHYSLPWRKGTRGNSNHWLNYGERILVEHIKQFYSSEYLLKKYAANKNDSPLVNNGKPGVRVWPSLGLTSLSMEVPSTPKGSDNWQRRPFSDSKLNKKTTTQRRPGKRGHKEAFASSMKRGPFKQRKHWPRWSWILYEWLLWSC